MLLVQCPHCKNQQKTDPKVVSKATKRCVYCGKSFKVYVPGDNRIIGKLDK